MQAQLTMFPEEPPDATKAQEAVARCPFLGLSWDRGSTSMFATEDHRCYATKSERKLDRRIQAAFCLGAQYSACSAYAKASIVPISAAAADTGNERILRYALAVTLPVATFLITIALRWTGQF